MSSARRFLPLALVLLPATAAAQRPDPFRLDEIVVSATARPMPLASVPASVTILRGDDLRARGIRTVADALRTVPGASVVSSGPDGSLTTLFLRGGEANYVQVLVDGVQVNEPGGTFDFADLVLDDVERIEVVRGPISVLYGSDAVSGVVHVVTKRGGSAMRMEAAADAGAGQRLGEEADGSYATTGASAFIGGNSGRLSYDVAGARRSSGGLYAFNNGYANLTGSGGLALEHDHGEVRLNARVTDATYHYPTNGGGALVDRNQQADRRSGLVGLTARQQLAPRVDLQLSLSTQAYRSVYEDAPDDAGDTLGVYASRSHARTAQSAADLRFDATLSDRITLSAGGEAERQAGETRYTSESSFGPFEDASDDDRSNLAGYAQVVAAGSRVSFTAGARADRNDRFGTFGTWRTGATVRVAADTRLRVAAGTAFKEPTFYENYAAGFVRGNPALEPERSRSWEAGIEQVLLDGRARVGATWFDQRFDDLIQYIGAPPTPEDPNYVNVGTADAKGLEATAAIVLGRFSVDASYTLLDTEVTEAGEGEDRSFLEGRPLLRRPGRQWNVAASWFAPGARVSLAAVHTGRRHDLDFSDPVDFAGMRVVLPSRTTFDLAGEAAIGTVGSAAVKLHAAIRNLTDERYEELANFPAPGRTVSFGVRAAIGR